MDHTCHNQSPNAIHLQWFGEDTSGAEGEPQGGAAGASAQGLFQPNPGNGGTAPLEHGAAGDGTTGAKESAAAQGTEGKPVAGKQTENTPPGYTAGLSAKMKADSKAMQFASKYKSFDELLAAGMDLESKLGASVRIPTAQSTPEEIAAYRKAANIPEKSEDYKLDKIEGVKTTPEQEKAYRDLALKYNLSQETAAGIWNAEQQAAKAMVEAHVKQSELDAQNLDNALKKEWGNDFSGNLEIVKRGMEAFTDNEFTRDVYESGLGNKPSLFRLMFKLGQMTAEGHQPGGKAAGALGTAKTFDYPGVKS